MNVVMTYDEAICAMHAGALVTLCLANGAEVDGYIIEVDRVVDDLPPRALLVFREQHSAKRHQRVFAFGGFYGLRLVPAQPKRLTPERVAELRRDSNALADECDALRKERDEAIAIASRYRDDHTHAKIQIDGLKQELKHAREAAMNTPVDTGPAIVAEVAAVVRESSEALTIPSGPRGVATTVKIVLQMLSAVRTVRDEACTRVGCLEKEKQDLKLQNLNLKDQALRCANNDLESQRAEQVVRKELRDARNQIAFLESNLNQVQSVRDGYFESARQSKADSITFMEKNANLERAVAEFGSILRGKHPAFERINAVRQDIDTTLMYRLNNLIDSDWSRKLADALVDLGYKP